MIRTKSVHSPIEREDGLRILATRFQGRYLPANRYDIWMPNLGPSEALLRAGKRNQITWPEFSRRYREELKESLSIDRKNPRIKNHGQKFTLRLLETLGRRQNVTLMCHCDEDEPHCHRHLLKKMLDAKIP
jgi:uncharacterized protein YeaO (DUF488 family)